MKKGRNLVAIALCLAMCYVPMQAAGYYKSKNVQYGGVSVYYNGAYQSAASQAVIIDGTTYLPVRSFSNMLGMNIGWNQTTHTVTIDGTPSSNAQIQAKDYEIAMLRKELETLKNEGVTSNTTTSTAGSSNSSTSDYDTTSGTDILGTEITATRRALDNEYSDYFDDVEFDFSLSLSSSKLKVTVSIDDSGDYKAFNRLSKSDVKDFMEDVCELIRERHDDIVISGVIEYATKDKDLYSFTYSKSNRLTYSEGSGATVSESSLRRIVDETSYVKINDYSGRVAVKDTEVSISDSRERVTFTLELNMTDEIKEAWNENTGKNNDYELREYLEEIADELSDEIDYEITGVLVDYSSDKEIGNYDYEDNEIYLYTID